MFGITDEKSLPKKNTFMAELQVLPFRLPATRILYCEMSRLLPQEDSVFDVLTGGCYSNERGQLTVQKGTPCTFLRLLGAHTG